MDLSYTANGNIKCYKPLQKTVWRFLKITCILLYKPVILLTTIYSTETKTYHHIKTCTVMFTEAFHTMSSTKKWSCSVMCNSLWFHGLQLLHPWNFPGKSTGVGCHFLLQGIFPTQGLNPGLPRCRQTLYPLSHQGSPWDDPNIHQEMNKQIVIYSYNRILLSNKKDTGKNTSEPQNHFAEWKTSLVVQWLRLHAPKGGDPGSIPGQRTISHILQLSSNTASKTQQSQRKKPVTKSTGCIIPFI